MIVKSLNQFLTNTTKQLNVILTLDYLHTFVKIVELLDFYISFPKVFTRLTRHSSLSKILERFKKVFTYLNNGQHCM